LRPGVDEAGMLSAPLVVLPTVGPAPIRAPGFKMPDLAMSLAWIEHRPANGRSPQSNTILYPVSSAPNITGGKMQASDVPPNRVSQVS
jgi:hypothetical protein